MYTNIKNLQTGARKGNASRLRIWVVAVKRTASRFFFFFFFLQALGVPKDPKTITLDVQPDSSCYWICKPIEACFCPDAHVVRAEAHFFVQASALCIRTLIPPANPRSGQRSTEYHTRARWIRTRLLVFTAYSVFGAYPLEQVQYSFPGC